MAKQTDWFEMTDDELFQSDLTDTADQLWEEIAAEKEKNRKSGLIKIYNKVAEECNRVFGREYIVLITSSTKVISASEQEQQLSVQAAKRGDVAIKPSELKKIAKATPIPSAKKVPGGKSIIEQILDLHREGKSNKEIVELGFNKSTVNRQVAEYKKRKANEQE